MLIYKYIPDPQAHSLSFRADFWKKSRFLSFGGSPCGSGRELIFCSCSPARASDPGRSPFESPGPLKYPRSPARHDEGRDGGGGCRRGMIICFPRKPLQGAISRISMVKRRPFWALFAWVCRPGSLFCWKKGSGFLRILIKMAFIKK